MTHPIRRLAALLLLATLAACGAQPQGSTAGTAPTAPASASAAVTAAPAATAAPDSGQSGEAQATATPEPPAATATEEPPAATATPEPPAAAATEETAMPTAESQSGSAPAPTRSSLVRPTPAPERVPTGGPAVTGEVPQDLLDQIIDDAARRAGVDRAQVVVTVGEAVEWPDGSLGCPQPGVAYLQVITPGYRVQLEAGASSYDYRVDDRGRFSICEAGR